MKEFVCNFNMFDLHQQIYLIDHEANTSKRLGLCSLETIGKMLVELCFANNVNKVHLFGNSEYAEVIKSDIDMHSGCSAYSNGLIEVEVN